MIMFVRYRYREPNGLIKLIELARPPRLRPRFGAPSSISFSLAQPRFDTAMPETDGRAGGMCACKSPISFAHFLHFKIRSAKEGERRGVSASKMGPGTPAIRCLSRSRLLACLC